ncbi:aldolase catalytic domain-containing protein [Rummeliibacillus stabekisii]|uniref:aldolase catalytic domain-containing protein n=1 Tax=Rummeliibacillus stabekisii TaxID=241244 RepID=UPI00203E8E97|nr:aldolase catalytic domain-containing protein [Rummeliibacillus stabekisii]MCM3318024.1 aldolase catalytic domain-containing protein [Rummeliibacillus stabekisii]
MLLDCTLRDGGYYTDWVFSEGLVNDYLNTISSLPLVNYIEIGYLRNLPDKDYGDFYYLPLETIRNIRNNLDKNKKIAVMINAKEYKSINHINDLLYSCKSYVDLIRIAVSPQNINHGIELARKIKEIGFEVALNIMYLSQINLNELENIICELANDSANVDFIYLVDSFGSCYPDEVTEKIKKAKSYCNIPIGFHGHDNLSLAFSNSISACKSGANIIDATITGIGRGAGNLATELYCTYEIHKRDLAYDFSKIESIVEKFKELKKVYDWGTSLPYIISGLNNIPQSKIMNLSHKEYKINDLLKLFTKQSN